MIAIYGMHDSGNCYKPRLLLAKLGLPFRHVETASGTGTGTSEFLAKNPNGRVPILELEDGRIVAESNAILLYLAEGTRFLPEDDYERALTYQWLFFEQYSHEPQIAVRRALLVYPHRAKEATSEKLAQTLTGGKRALTVMAQQLARTSFIAGKKISVADLALYAYTHSAHEGGFDLLDYPEVLTWLRRVEADPGHVPIDWLP